MKTKNPVRIAGGILAGAGVVFLGGVLFASTPALADNGVHIATTGNMAVERCAGCHRAHTAKATYLLKTDEVDLCTTCHGAGGTGASTDVLDGIGYTDSTRGTAAGALRGGGFEYALIDGDSGVAKTSIGVLATGQATTSAHSVDGTAKTAWGGGALNSGNGTSVTLECTSCHDPHGNGNWRILRSVPTGGTAIATAAPVGITSLSKNAVLTSGTTYVYDVVTAAPNTFKVTDPVTVVGSTGGDTLIGATVKTIADTTHFTISMRSVNVTTTVTDGQIGYAMPNAIAKVTGDGTNVTYKTWNVHGLVVGQLVTITGFTPTGYNVTKAAIVSVPTTTTFTVANVTTAAATVFGSISGIPDALGTKVYTQSNYWVADDHNYSGVYVASGTAPTAVIANVSQWCSTCHTRYLAGSGAWGENSGDTEFTFRHRSQNGKDGSPNCLQCHVAHGSNAQMNGANTSTFTDPDGTNPNAGSRLLRADNRGVCNMCHNL